MRRPAGAVGSWWKAASGFLLTDTPPADIVRAVRAVAAGEPMLSPTITRRLIGHVTDSEGGERRRHAREQLERLTDREREVAVAVGQGKSNPEISRELYELYMSVATVKAHVSRVLEKLQFNSRAPRSPCSPTTPGRLDLQERVEACSETHSAPESPLHSRNRACCPPSQAAPALEAWLHRRLAELDGDRRTRLLRQFAVWHQLPKLRAEAMAWPLTPAARRFADEQFTQARKLLAWIQARGRTPAEVTQADVDAWHASHRSHEKLAIRAFLTWAMLTGRLPRLHLRPFQTRRTSPSPSGAALSCCAGSSPTSRRRCAPGWRPA